MSHSVFYLSVSDSRYGQHGLLLDQSGRFLYAIWPIVAALMLTCAATSCIDMPCDRSCTAEFSLSLEIGFIVDRMIIKH